jgi:hypothetical protein
VAFCIADCTFIHLQALNSKINSSTGFGYADKFIRYFSDFELMLTNLLKMDDSIDIAKKDIFVYGWTNMHKVFLKKNTHEIVEIPKKLFLSMMLTMKF